VVLKQVMKRLALTAIGLLVLGLLPPAAAADPWKARRITAQGATASRGVDVLPNGRTALLLQRRAGGQNRLELRIDDSTRLLDSSPHAFLSSYLGHDARGRLVVVWRRIAGPAIQAFAWTQRTGRQQVTAARTSVSDLSLSVAANGRAALAYYTADGISLARGASSRGFGAAAGVASVSAHPGIAVSSSGRLVVAWCDGRRVLLRAAGGAGALGAVQVVRLRAPAAGNTLAAGAPEVAITNAGRAVVVVSSSELRGTPAPGTTPVVTDRRVEALEWPRKAARPGAVATLSRGASAGDADAVAYGSSAAIAWTQRPTGAPRSLWIARWTPRGLQRPNVYDTRMLDSPVLLTPAPRGAVDAFYSTARRWFTVRLRADGLYRGTSTVTPPGVQVATIDVASAGRFAAAAWTVRDRGTYAQLARP
jgi:hypothetical protein